MQRLILARVKKTYLKRAMPKTGLIRAEECRHLEQCKSSILNGFFLLEI